jgi:hypothetical protein
MLSNTLHRLIPERMSFQSPDSPQRYDRILDAFVDDTWWWFDSVPDSSLREMLRWFLSIFWIHSWHHLLICLLILFDVSLQYQVLQTVSGILWVCYCVFTFVVVLCLPLMLLSHWIDYWRRVLLCVWCCCSSEGAPVVSKNVTFNGLFIKYCVPDDVFWIVCS